MPPTASESNLPERPNRRARVAVWFPEFSPWRIGGAEFRVVQGLRLLAGRCGVTLITRHAPPPETLDAQYGGSLQSTGFRVALDDRYAWIPGDSLRRQCRDAMVRHHFARHGGDYDLVLGMLNTVDCPQGGVHWIVDCMFDAELYRHVTGGAAVDAARKGTGPYFRTTSTEDGGADRPKNGPVPFVAKARSGVRRAACAVVQWALGRPRTPRQIAADPRNRLVVNSRWMADAVAACYGIARPTVLYPPVVAEFPDVPWPDREPGFVVVGRVGPEKRLERIVAIVDAVRRAGHENLHLHIAGHIPDTPYGIRLVALVRDKPWIALEGEVAGEAKARLIASHRFALHACEVEGFGIAVAEYVKAGCLPFVPNRGGGAEIVPFDELQYETETDAAGRIAALLDHAQRQDDLRDRLAQHYAGLRLDDFDRRFLEIVQEELSSRGFPEL